MRYDRRHPSLAQNSTEDGPGNATMAPKATSPNAAAGSQRDAHARRRACRQFAA